MKKTSIFSILLLIMTFTGVIQSKTTPEFSITQLTDRIQMLTTDRGSYTTNVLVSIGEDGILLVDTDDTDAAEELKRVVDGFGHGAPKIIINTHMHAEHVGGNAAWGDDPVIIGHDLMRKRMRRSIYLFDEYPDDALPDITLTDSLAIYFNGEKIRIIALPGAHVDNEVIIHFTESKVAHVGPLSNGMNFPSIDSTGDVLKYPEMVRRALDLLPHDVTIVSGHNRTSTWNEMNEFHEMLVKTTHVVREKVDEGKNLEQLQEEKVVDPWNTFAGSYVSCEGWIEYLYEGMQEHQQKKTVFEPLYYVYKDHGTEATIAKYHELKDDTDTYDTGEFDLLMIGAKMIIKERWQDAVDFHTANLELWPEGDYLWYTHYQLGLAYRGLDRRDDARRNVEKSLELNPDNKRVKTLLKELETLK